MVKQWQIDKKKYEHEEFERIQSNRLNHRPDCYRDNHCVYNACNSFEECTSICKQFTNWDKGVD